MRLLALAAVALALFSTAAGAATSPPSPIDVYTDFANHGRLTKVYPRPLLHSIVNDASLNQYGDPVLMLRLRRAVQLQLAGVMPSATPPPTTAGRTTPPTGTSTSTSTPAPPTTTAPASSGKGRGGNHPAATTPRASNTAVLPHASAQPLLSTRQIALAVVGFLLAVGLLSFASVRARRAERP